MRLFFILLCPLFSFGQIWPGKDCVDTPYTKGNDGIIYHTGKCGVPVFEDKPTMKIVRDSLYCYMCGRNRTRDHVMQRVLVGALEYGVDEYGIHKATPLGLYLKKYDIPFLETFDTSTIPVALKKYLPKDYYANSNYYVKLLNESAK